MEIPKAYDPTSSFHAAAELAGCDPKAVARYGALRDGGGDRARTARPEGIDPFLEKIEGLVERSKGRIRADVVHQKIAAMGFAGSERTSRWAVARAKSAYEKGSLHTYRPWITDSMATPVNNRARKLIHCDRVKLRVGSIVLHVWRIPMRILVVIPPSVGKIATSDRKEYTVLSLLKRSAAIAAVGMSAAAGILANPPAASASTGDWGWPQRSGPVSHGMTDFTTFGLQCLASAGCTASVGTTLTLTPQAGATILNPNQSSFPFVTSDTNTQVGTCVTDQYGLQCTLSSAVSLAYEDELIGNAVGSGVSLFVPRFLEPGTTVGEYSWFDPTGMTGTNPPTDTLVYVVVGRAHAGWSQPSATHSESVSVSRKMAS